MMIANLGVDVIDVGVPILSMHAPFEVASKADIYSAYRGYCVLDITAITVLVLNLRIYVEVLSLSFIFLEIEERDCC